MEMIILSNKSSCPSGGRSQKLGSLVFGNETRAIFVGYTPEGLKCALKAGDLNEILWECNLDYKIEIRAIRRSNPLSVIKFMAKVVPHSLKERIRNEV